MNDYIKREDALEIAIQTCGDYAAAWAEIRKLPAANVVENDTPPPTTGKMTLKQAFFILRHGSSEGLPKYLQAVQIIETAYDNARRALGWMWYAYANKDGECPHDFEVRAVEMAEEVLGKWEDCMPELMRDEGEVDRYAKLLRKWEKVSKECAQDAQIVPVDFDWRATWVKAADATPPEDIEVLVSCKTASGGRYQCIACCYEDGEQTEYYYVDPGWHKGTRTWEEIRPAVRIKDTVTHWMRLPTFPKRLPND